MSEWKRMPVPQVLKNQLPNTRAWGKVVDDGVLSVLRTVEQTADKSRWRMHISISHRVVDELTLQLVPGRYPTWDEQKEAVWRFAPGKAMISYLPAEGDRYVNIHPTTFHWWEDFDGEPGNPPL